MNARPLALVCAGFPLWGGVAEADSPWRTVNVTAATCVDGNTASTAALVRGETATARLERAGLPARLVRHDGRATTLGGRPRHLVAQGPS